MATTVYVSTNGVDTFLRDGSTNETWATVNYALTRIGDNDTIKIKPGNYTLTSPIKVSSLSGITITAEDILRHPGRQAQTQLWPVTRR